MKRAVCSLLIMLSGYAQAWQKNEIPQVPSFIEIAGMKLKITNEAREEIQKDVNALRASEKYFRIKLDRVNLYFPIIERVFKEEGVPDDLKFLSVQESALISDAVSTSDAVGYWQFKDFTAREVGLRVDNKVDERKNIVSASHGAAKYFKRNNIFFNNWIYAVNAYMTGPGGAQRFVDKSNFGKDKMTIDKNTHWYVMRFIAHVIAFRDEIGEPHSEGLKLVEYTKGTNKHLDDIADKFNVDRELAKEYNKWLRHGKIPDDKPYTVILPIKGKVPKIKDDDTGTPPLTRTKEEGPVVYPKVLTGEIINKKVMEVEINGKDAVIAASGDNLVKLASKTGISGNRLERLNDLRPGQEVKAGEIYYTQRKRNRSPIRFHVAQYDESLWDISQKYGVKLEKLARKNRMEMTDPVKPGRVIWLRKNRDANEPIEYEQVPKPKPRPVHKEPVRVIVEKDEPDTSSSEESGQERVSGSTPPEISTNQPLEKVVLFKYHPVKEGETLSNIAAFYGLDETQILEWNELNAARDIKPGLNLRLKTDKEIRPVRGKKEIIPVTQNHSGVEATSATKYHVVQAGETLWGISRQYEVTVEELTLWNNLEGGVISPGQKLKVRKDALELEEEEPRKPKATSEEITEAMKDHVVQAGESLWSLAQKYGVTVEDLQRWNDLKPDDALAIGQKILLAVSDDTEEEAPSNAEYATFIVKGGDSLYKIAREYNMTVEELMELNNLESTNLSVGQELKVITK